MKRDMDLVRHILLEAESADDDVQLQELTCGDWTLEMVGYHVELMCTTTWWTASCTGRAAAGSAAGSSACYLRSSG